MEYFPFGFLKQANQTFLTMFKINNSVVNYNNHTLPSSGPLIVPHEVVLLFKGLMVTHIMPLIYIFIVLLSVPLNSLAMVTFNWFKRGNQQWFTCLTWRVWTCSSLCCCLWRSTISWTLQIGCSVRRRVVCSVLLTTATCTAPYCWWCVWVWTGCWLWCFPSPLWPGEAQVKLHSYAH